MVLGGCQLATGTDRSASTLVPSSEEISFDAVTEGLSLTIDVLDQDGASMPDAHVTWTSLNPSIAAVSDGGYVTAVGNGTTSIVATAGRASAEIAVTVEQTVMAIALEGGAAQQGEVGRSLAEDVAVQLVDRLGSPAVGVDVSFEVVLGGGSVTTSVAATGPNGVATSEWTLGEVAGSPQRLEASVVSSPSLSVVATAAALPGPAADVTKSGGDAQAAQRQTPLDELVSVEVLDRFGNPVEGALVVWEVTGGTGIVTPPAGTTDAEGVATASWSLGPELGDQSLTASVPSLAEPVEFSATALAIPEQIQGLTGAGQVGVVGQALDVAPTVRIVDGQGLPVPQVDVTFSVLSGDGLLIPSVEGGPSTAPVAMIRTGPDGTAGPASWVLGTSAGVNVLRAEVEGLPPFTFSATALPGPASQLTKVYGEGQEETVGAALPVPVAVRLSDAYGNPVGGAAVEFAPTVGSGSAAPSSTASGEDGIAATTWTLGFAAGTHQLVVTAGALDPVVFSATATSGGGGGGGSGGSSPGYDIEYEYTVPVASHIRAVFQDAADRWASIITGDLPDASVQGGWCGDSLPSPSNVDDLYVVVTIEPIDGAGSILGSAGPCLIRSGSSLTAVGRVRLDQADVNNLYSQGKLEAVILHELGHVIGIGTLWGTFGLLQNPSLPSSPGVDTHFTGSAATSAFNAIGGSSYHHAKVPVENSQGGQGTRDAHWREDVFENELMTGYLSGGSQPLSRVTAASLADLGYVVNEGAADGFSLPSTAPPATAPQGTPPVRLDEEILSPIGTVDPSGGVAPISPSP